MVADGAEAARAALAAYFALHGWDVAVAGTAIDAIVQALTRDIDVVIMNVRLPGLAGVEAAAILRKLRPRIRVLLTSHGDADVPAEESEWSESFQCFPAPLDFAAIERAIRESDAGRDQEEGR